MAGSRWQRAVQRMVGGLVGWRVGVQGRSNGGARYREILDGVALS